MNILFLTPRNSKKNLGGVEKHVRILTEELERRGHKVKELCLDEVDGFNKGRAFEYKGQALETLFKLQAWMYLWRKRDLFRWAEVVHVHDVFWWVLPLLPMIFIKNSNRESPCHAARRHPIFVTFHGWEGVCPPTRSAVWQKRLASRFSNGTIGVGSFYEKWYGIKPDKIVWGVVDPEINKGRAFRLAKGPALRKIIFLGRLEKVNGIELVIKARPFRERPGLFRYIFVGDGSYRRQAEKFGKVTGMVKNPEKYLVDADVVIASSYMSILEAAALEKPIIAIANNELKMDYLDGHPLRKYFKVVKNAGELVKVISGLNKGLAFEYKGQALGTGKAMSWALKQTPEKLADIYESLWRISIN